MVLIRMLVLNCLQHNRRVFVKYVKSKENTQADSLSPLRFDLFRAASPQMYQYPDAIHPDL